MYSFGSFSFEARDLSLAKDGQRVKLEPQPAKALAKLLERNGQIVTREELCEAVWQKGTFVEYEQGLHYCLGRIRKALDDSPSHPRFIETLPKQGYRFIAPLANVDIAPSDDIPPRHEIPPVSIPPLPSTPRYRVHWRIGIAAAALLVLLASALWITRRHPVPRPSMPAIAVIPLANRTGVADLDATADSLTEGLIRGLSDTGLLKVYGRATMFSFRGQERNARAVGRNLGATVVVSGHIDRPGPNLALDVEISDVRDGSVLFSYRYLLGADYSMQVQADLVRDTLNALGADPCVKGAGLISPPSLNPQAYRAFITGQSKSRHFTPPTMLAATASFESAVRLDPKFATAWAELAEDELYMGIYFDDPKKWMPKARQAAQESLRLDPGLDNPKTTVALVDLLYDWRIPEADAALTSRRLKRIAISSFSCTAHLLHQTGRNRRAEEEVRDALTLDPRNPGLICELGCVAYYNGRYEEAIRSFQDALRVDPQSAVAAWGVGRTLSMQGKYSEAISFLDKYRAQNGHEPPIITAERGFAAASMGDRQSALKCLDQLRAPVPASYVDSYLLATVYLGLKDFDNAFLMLNRAVDQKSAFAISVFTDPHWEAVRDDSRFSRVLQRIGPLTARVNYPPDGPIWA
jgi:DNA-binding winged helix-turn-helix (wHTH) protein/TolB-like protein/tetratricopeptide (TPR) repeat protein